MDRSTYEAIQRLANAGFLKMDRSSIHQLHSSPAFADRALIEREKSWKKAQKIFSQAERKMQMSRVLAEGGFALEALTPLGQAVELALKASAYLAGEDDVDGEGDLSLTYIQSRIIPTGILPAYTVAIVASLRESVKQPEGLDEDAVLSLIRSSQELISQINQAVNKSALG
jgi:hypothetical protein